jgi:hypothetical protein
VTPERARRLFFAGLGLVFLAAFASLSVQIVGLVGERGLLPIGELLQETGEWGARSGRLSEVRWQLPTLCWLDASDASLRWQCGGGIALSLLLVLGVAPIAVVPLSWALYLSLTVAGQDFFQFQWDVLLLETAFFAAWFAPAGLLPWGPPRWLLLKRAKESDPIPAPPTAVSRWALWLLLFRFLFASGYVKLSSGDASWRDFTALTYHYWTQPLPTPIAWFVHQAPLGFHKASCVGMFAVELAAPFLLFCGWLGRRLLAALTILLMAVLVITGNYGFFEPLTIVLAIPLLARPERAPPKFAYGASAVARRFVSGAIAGAATLLALQGFAAQIDERAIRWAPAGAELHDRIAPFRSINTYGLFRNMTKERPEIVIEGSADGERWLAYEFRWKPGDPKEPPRWCAPHMPRLDWQMWFAALGGPYRRPEWFERLLQRLLEGEPSVLRLLATNPFADAPPEHVRARLYDYRFTTPATRASRGEWWFRVDRGLYAPPVSLR